MQILIDTNVIIDAITSREPFFKDSYDVLALCANNSIDGFVAAHSIPDIFYILRKTFNNEQRKLILLSVCEILSIVGLDKQKIIKALYNEQFDDFEDCLQDECAKEICADYIITRNKKDFENSSIPVKTPQEFLGEY